MAITSVGFDGTVTEAQWSNTQLRGSEGGYRHFVWTGGDVTPGTGRAVSVGVLDAWVAGTWHVSDTATPVALDANGSTNRRIDYIVLDVDWVANTATITRVTGTAASNPIPPVLTQTAGVRWQMPLARVTVRPGATTIAVADIEVCKPLRRNVRRDEGAIPADTIRGSATDWRGLSTLVVTDPGWPYRLQVSAAVRFNATESSGFMRIRISDADGTVYGEGITGDLRGGKEPAVISARMKVGDLSGTRRVRLEMLPADLGAGEVVQVLDHGINHFTVIQHPS